MVEVNRDNFEAEVVQAGLPVLVDFWGPACGPCLALMPTVEELAREWAGRLKVVKVNAAENRRLCLAQRVFTLPTFLVFYGGREVGRLVGGDITPEGLQEFVRQVLTELENRRGCACS